MSRLEKQLKNLSTNYTLDWFTNKNNIPNQELVNSTIEYFETGAGSRRFKPLHFLNLFQKQWEFVVSSWYNETIVMDHLRGLSLDAVDRHILMGIMLKWFGGYPVNPNMEIDSRVGQTKKAIESEFLNFEGDTPEKEFCKADSGRRKHLMRMGRAMTMMFNNPDMDADEVFGAVLGHTKTKYHNFDDLFDWAYKSLLVPQHDNRANYLLDQLKYKCCFDEWLLDNKNWLEGNDRRYEELLTESVFIEFLESDEGKGLRVTKIKLSSERGNDGKSPSAKFYALYHWMLVEMGRVNNFSLNSDDRYVRKDIEAYAKQKYPKASSQMFYREYKDIDITQKNRLPAIFGQNYKNKIKEIAGNDEQFLYYLEKYP